MPINDGFVTAVDTNGNKRRVPEHYLRNKRLGYKLPPKQRAAQRTAPKGPEPTTEPQSSHVADEPQKENN